MCRGLQGVITRCSPLSDTATPPFIPLSRTAAAEGGDNFSQGQRQLITLARVLLRRSEVLLLDEASSSLDHASDLALQAAIRQSFAGRATVITSE
jgi:ABC-type multidrug transport system fused ATPase/permease subunit